MEAHPKEIEHYLNAKGQDPFAIWMNTLIKQKIHGIILNRLDRVTRGNFGSHHSVGDGVSELVVDFGPGYRIYYGQDTDKVILLGGGTKKKASERTSRRRKSVGETTMPKRTKNHREWLREQLTNPVVAAHYINAAIQDSPDMILVALRNVAEAIKMSKVADDAGVNRETLYRTLSKQGNPTLNTLNSVLGAVGLNFKVEPREAFTTGNASGCASVSASDFLGTVVADPIQNASQAGTGFQITSTCSSYASFGSVGAYFHDVPSAPEPWVVAEISKREEPSLIGA